MNTLIVLCAVVAVSMAKPGYLAGGIAGLAGYAAPLGYAGLAGHYAAPILTAQGVPVDTPEVQAARAAHFAAHAQARANAAAPGAAVYGPAPVAIYGAAPAGVLALGGAAGGFAYSSTSLHPAPGVVGHGYGYHEPAAPVVLTPAGVPVDTPEVQAARAADAVAHLNAKARNLYG